MMVFLLIKSLKLDSDEDWAHAWRAMQNLTFKGDSHADISDYFYKWDSMCDGVGDHVPKSMKLKLLEDQLAGKPLLENDLAH